MSEFNDEILNPEIFEKMANEYSKSLNNFKLKKINEDTNLQNEIKQKLLKYFNNIFCYIKNLKKFSLNAKRKLMLENLDKHFSSLKPSFEKLSGCTLDAKTIYADYCGSLSGIILNCCDSLKVLDSFLEFYLDDNNDIKTNLIELIRLSTNMFGVCTYRK